MGSYAEVSCQKIARRILKNTIYYRNGQFLHLCLADGGVHVIIRDDDKHGDFILYAVRRCDGSCVRGEMEIPQEFHVAISRFLETGEQYSVDEWKRPAIRVHK